jgi:hypothetical protein
MGTLPWTSLTAHGPRGLDRQSTVAPGHAAVEPDQVGQFCLRAGHREARIQPNGQDLIEILFQIPCYLKSFKLPKFVENSSVVQNS